MYFSDFLISFYNISFNLIKYLIVKKSYNILIFKIFNYKYIKLTICLRSIFSYSFSKDFSNLKCLLLFTNFKKYFYFYKIC